jgi:hypothetical protein
MIVLLHQSNGEPMVTDCMVDAMTRLATACGEVEASGFSTPGIEPRDNASFRLSDGASLWRTESDSRRTGTYDRTLQMTGRGPTVRLQIFDASRSSTGFGIESAARSIRAMGTMAKAIAAAAPTATTELEAVVQDMAACVLARADDVQSEHDRRVGIRPTAKREGDIVLASPWSRLRVRPFGRCSHASVEGADLLPTVLVLRAYSQIVRKAPTTLVQVWTKQFVIDAAAVSPMDRLRMEAAMPRMRRAA